MASKRVARRRQNAIQRFFRETMGELRKVSWPTRREAINLTRIVLIVIAVLGAFFGILDILFSQFFGRILGG